MLLEHIRHNFLPKIICSVNIVSIPNCDIVTPDLYAHFAHSTILLLLIK